MTHDELIAAGIWSGTILEVRKRMADYTVDGVRFGTMCMTTKSGSPNDVHLEKRISEITTAAMVLSRLGHEGVQLISAGFDGRPLERPDLDARLPDGTYVGIEIADVSETSLRKHESGRNLIETMVGDLLAEDEGFRDAFGANYLTLTLDGVGPYRGAQIQSKKEAQSIADEIVRFVRSGAHLLPTDDSFGQFPAEYETLHRRGAQYHAGPMEHGPYLTVGEGASTIARVDRRTEFARVLDAHRDAAKNYRPLPTWIFLFLTDSMEYFYNTASIVEQMKPTIAPFQRAYVMDAAARIVMLE